MKQRQIIPYQELSGNYNHAPAQSTGDLIIPYQELSGNYNTLKKAGTDHAIIPYQELSGNYNLHARLKAAPAIIPYQELSGNYNELKGAQFQVSIIPYQELSGNYNQYRKQAIRRTIIQKLHFKPNPLARSLRTGRSGIIAIAIPEIDNPYFSNIFRNVQNCFTDMGYLPMMLRTSTVQEAEQAADLLKSGLMSGVLCYDDGQVNALLYDDEINVPVIRLAPLTDKRDSDYSVLIDLKPGIELLCRELSSNGVATVGYIGPVDDASSSTKFKAIQEYCEKYSLLLRKDAIYTNCYGYNGGYLNCEKMLSEITLLPDAIICESDMIAMGVLKSFCHHNIRVPEDIKLSGYDNTEIAVMSNPSLTSINIPLNDICSCASEMLINLIQGKFSEDMQKHVIFSTELEVRTSTKEK